MTMADSAMTTNDGLGEVAAGDGPWSLADAPAGAQFFDFGPLQLPAIPGTRARVEVDPKRGEPGAVAVQINDCHVQFQVIAARGGQALWPRLRKALLTNLRAQAGLQQVVEGKFGSEILATVTRRSPTGLWHDTPNRVLGIDGDRWLLRVFVTGASATSDATIARVNAYVSQVAVDRGTDARAEGEVLALRQPPGEVFVDVPDDLSSLDEKAE